MSASEPSVTKWTKQMPQKAGMYWIATRDGFIAGVRFVAKNCTTGAFFEVGIMSHWEGWWWDEPINMPPVPEDKWE